MGRRRSGQVAYVRGRWMARVALHREPPAPNGRPHYGEVPVLRDGAEVASRAQDAVAHARRYAERLQVRYDEGTWEPPGRKTAAPATVETSVQGWVLPWLGRQTYSEAGRDRKRVEQWLGRTPRFANLPVGRVVPKDVAAWLGELRGLPTEDGGPPAPRTVRNIADPLARALRGAVFEGLLVADPFAPLPTEIRPKAEDADPMARRGYRLARMEVETLLGEPSVEDRWAVMWHLLVLTGMRVSEVIALRWDDLLDDALLRRVIVVKQVHHRTREIVPLKTKDCREPPEHPLLREALDWWWRVGWRAEYGCEPRRGSLVVPCRGKPGRPWGTAEGAGGPLWQQDVHRALQRDLEACGLRAHRVHDFRHTLASLCADAGMAEAVAARWTHAPSGKTARHLYALPSWERQCLEMRKLVLTPRSRWAQAG